jgi:malate dehydrogenase (oxaloacetate-decarboxylating)(NADP+)
MLVESGYADAMISGLTRNYPDTLAPALKIIGKKHVASIVSGMYMVITKQGPYFLADCTVNKNPTVEQLVEITLQTAYAVRQFKMEPRIAFVSYSNFGSNEGRIPQMQRDAVSFLHENHPDLIVDGEMQVNVALNEKIMQEEFPFSKLAGKRANTLIFPYLTAGNIAYKLLQSATNYDVIGPVINGMNKSVHVLQMGSSVNEIVNMVMIAVLDAQCTEKRLKGEKCE